MNRFLHLRTLAVIPALIILLVTSQTARSQTIHMDHTTIFVVDLAKSAEFYEKVIGLTRISEPFHDGKHIWFRIGDHAQLHVVSGAKQTIPHDINIHLAFSVPSVEAFSRNLDRSGVKYGNWAGDSKAPQLRPDGIKQIYLQDPDGYWLEINDDKF